jgi:hypothetical protein
MASQCRLPLHGRTLLLLSTRATFVRSGAPVRRSLAALGRGESGYAEAPAVKPFFADRYRF